MRISIRLTLGLLLAALFSVSAIATPGDVLDQFPTPTAHPTGLTYDGSTLWMADRLTDSLYAISPKTGELRFSLPAPGFIPRGLAWDGEYLWCVDQQEQRILQLEPGTGETIHSVESPTPSIQGITWDEGDLWIVDDREDALCRISAVDGTVIDRFRAPSMKPTGLARWNQYLLCGDRIEDRIYLIDREHEGEVVYSFAAPGSHVRGLTVVNNRLWAVDYQEDQLYNIAIAGGDEYRQFDEHTLDLTLIHEYTNYGPGEVTEAAIHIAVPHDMPTQTLLKGPTFSPQPDMIIEDRWGQKVAIFQLSTTDLATRTRVTMHAKATLYAVEWYVLPDNVGGLSDIPQDTRELYLVDEDKYRIEDPRIQNAVAEAIGDEDNPYWMMRNIHRYIRERLHYELSGGWNVAPRVLERGNGSCSEYTFLFISMCRAAGIPARYVGSLVIRGDEASTDDVFHRWSQVYLPNYGWIHVDPQGGDKEWPGEVAASIGKLPNRFLITTEGGGASDLLGWGYNYDSHWQAKGPVKVHTEVFAEWQPAD